MSDAPQHRNTVLHPAPRLRVPAGEQLRAVGIAIRREAAAVAAVVAVPTLAAFLHAQWLGESFSFDGVDDVAGLAWMAAAVALLAPLAVWKGEARFGGSPLWFLPVDHRRHALLKVGAGWAWLMAVVAAGILCIFLVTLLGGGTFGAEEALLVLDASRPSGARSLVWTTPWWQWVAAFTGATALYLLGSALLLATAHPWRWVAGAALVAFVLSLPDEGGRAAWLDHAWDSAAYHVSLGPYGLDALLTGGTEGLEIVRRLPSGEPELVWRELPAPGRWAKATVLWTGLGLAAVLGAASRHRQGRAK